jgi:hypothetical protein
MIDASVPRILVVDRQARTRGDTTREPPYQPVRTAHGQHQALLASADETPTLSDRLDLLVRETEAALPSVFA